MTAEAYAQALLSLTKEATNEEKERYVSRMFDVMKEKGHEALLPRVLIKLEAAQASHTEELVAVARDTDFDYLKQDIQKACDTLGLKEYKEIVDPSLIGGYEVRSANRQINASWRYALYKIYQKVAA